MPLRMYYNLIGYENGGSILIASKCCKAGYVVNKNINYEIIPYLGEKKVDDWGFVILTSK